MKIYRRFYAAIEDWPADFMALDTDALRVAKIDEIIAAFRDLRRGFDGKITTVAMITASGQTVSPAQMAALDAIVLSVATSFANALVID